MKKNILLFLLVMYCTLPIMAQVGIGTNTPNANAALEISSSSQGVLFPRMTTAQRDSIGAPVNGLTIYNTTLNCLQTNIGSSLTANWRCLAGPGAPSSRGTAIVSSYNCSDTSQGTLIVGTACSVASGVKQTITASVLVQGTYDISATANGVTFAASGTFNATGNQTIILTASGTPKAKGSNTFTLNTSPYCSFSRYASVTGVYANVNGTIKDFMPYNLGVTGIRDTFSYQSGNNNGGLYQWGRQTDGHQVRTSDTALGPISTPWASTSFIKSSTTPFDWRSPQNNTLWGDGSLNTDPAKSSKDPCPSGFKVPSQFQWGGLYKGGTASGSPSSATENRWTWTGNGYLIGSNLYLPAAGYRVYSNAVLTHVGTIGYYWSSRVNVSGGGTNGNYLYISNNTVTPNASALRSNGFSVRCIEE